MFKRLGPEASRIGGYRTSLLCLRASRRQFQPQCASMCTTTNPSPSTAELGGLTAELDRIAPRFEVPASKITILNSPSLFYETLKNKISNANRRIYLSTLYIGHSEHELIATVDCALRRNPELKVSILTDALRGTRESPQPSCASLLAPLVSKHGAERVDIRMFHTPNLRGTRKRFIPKRINEGWGLQHMKLYGVDDEIILSGANLSSNYFTNRVDRYHVFSSKALADYYHQIHHAICSLSFQIQPDSGEAGYRSIWPSSNQLPSPLVDAKDFVLKTTSRLKPLIQAPADSSESTASSSTLAPDSTYVYPVAQFTPLLTPDVSTEYAAVTAILRSLSAASPSPSSLVNSRWFFTAGYFNMHPAISSLLISSISPDAQNKSAHPNGTVLAASPWANGFYGSPGVSGMLPAAYTHLAASFLHRVAKNNRSKGIQLKEWRRGTVNEPDGWTYHAKGLWITPPGEQGPSLTIIGSSNYTKRSYGLDLEVGAVVVTREEQLKRKLREEIDWLQKDANVTTLDDLKEIERRVGLQVRSAMWLVEKLGGAL